jgi:hypothetical protein
MNIIVSFPRSGQHLVEKILEFCCKEHDIDFTYCEFYSCCKSIPCNNGKNTSKNHDFDLDLKISDDIKYISLYRKDMILQLESYYRYLSEYNDCEYNYDDLLSFIIKSSNYYKGFVEKWIDNEKTNILKIDYYDIVKNPIEFSIKIFKHFYPDVPLKLESFEKLKEIELKVYTPGISGEFYKKISLINKLDNDVYNKLKKDLNI